MSQHPSRGGPPSGWQPVGRPSAPSPFRPASPYSPTPGPQYLQQQQQQQQQHQHQQRAPALPPGYHHHHQHHHPGMLQPMSPVPVYEPVSPAMSPMFGGPPAGTVQFPRPRRPAAMSPGNVTPRPYVPSPQQQRPPSAPMATGCRSPQPCGPPEYLIAPYRPGDYEFVGVPLDPSQTTTPDDEDSGPSTAEIIASQSQDYVDEKLAEYQATIHQLQVKGFTAEGILNGYRVKPGQFKHQVSLDIKGALNYTFRSACGGALIANNFALSAAFCVIGRNGIVRNRWYQVRVGTLNISHDNGIVVDVDTIYIPKSYNWTVYENNLALIKMKDGLDINENSPYGKLSLPKPNMNYQKCYGKVYGYGFNKARVLLKPTGERILIGSKDYTLRYVTVKILSNRDCQRQIGFSMPDTEMCGQSVPQYHPDEQLGICSGDSGSPLVHNQQIIGIASKSYYDCNDVVRPTKYTRVNLFLGFIESILSENPPPGTHIISNPSNFKEN